MADLLKIFRFLIFSNMNINNLIEECANNSDLLSLLRKIKILATKLEQKELLDFINYEIDGYPSAKLIPKYRKIPTAMQWYISNWFYTYENQTISINHIEDIEMKDCLQYSYILEWISGIMHYVDEWKSFIYEPVDLIFFQHLEKQYISGFKILNANKIISLAKLKEMIDIVRNKLLDFLLELSQTIDPNQNILDFNMNLINPSEKNQVQQIVTNIFYNSNFLWTTQIGNVNLQNNFNKLKKIWVKPEDIWELQTILEQKDGKNITTWKERVQEYLDIEKASQLWAIISSITDVMWIFN